MNTRNAPALKFTRSLDAGSSQVTLLKDQISLKNNLSSIGPTSA